MGLVAAVAVVMDIEVVAEVVAEAEAEADTDMDSYLLYFRDYSLSLSGDGR